MNPIIVKQNYDKCFTNKGAAGIIKLKKSMEETCKDLGLSMTTAFTIFAKKMTREKRIPFDVSVDPFYSESNMAYLKKVVEDIESGKAVLAEHELIED